MRPSRWRRWPSASSPRRTTFTKESRPSWRSAHRSSRVRESTVPVGESLPSHRDDAFLGQGLNLPRGVSEGSKDFPGVLAFCGHPCRVARLQGRVLRWVGDHLEFRKAGHIDAFESATSFHLGVVDDIAYTLHVTDRSTF